MTAGRDVALADDQAAGGGAGSGAQGGGGDGSGAQGGGGPEGLGGCGGSGGVQALQALQWHHEHWKPSRSLHQSSHPATDASPAESCPRLHRSPSLVPAAMLARAQGSSRRIRATRRPAKLVTDQAETQTAGCECA